MCFAALLEIRRRLTKELKLFFRNVLRFLHKGFFGFYTKKVKIDFSKFLKKARKDIEVSRLYW